MIFLKVISTDVVGDGLQHAFELEGDDPGKRQRQERHRGGSRMYRGYLAFFVSTFCLAAGDALIKALSHEVSPVEIILFRTLGILFVSIIGARGEIRDLAKLGAWAFHGTHIARSLSFVLALLLIVISVRRLPLSQVHALLASAPLLTILLSTLFLREHVTKLFWILCLVSLCGVLLIVAPAFDTLDIAMLLPLGAAVMMSVYTITTRIVGRQVSMSALLFHTGVTGLIVSIFAIEPRRFMAPDTDLIILLAIGLLGALAQLLLVAALSWTEAARLQPLAYCLYVWALMFDIAVFGIRVDAASLMGGVLIVVCGIGTVLYARLRAP